MNETELYSITDLNSPPVKLQSDGPWLRKVIEQDEFEGIKMTNLNMSQFISARKHLVKNLVEALEKRFSDFSSTSQSVIHATRIVDLQTWPENWDELKGFGDQELQVLMEHYGEMLTAAGIEVNELEFEWTLLKTEIHNEREDGRSHYQFIPLPLPNQIVVFTVGEWSKSQQSIEATINYKGEPLQLGKITRNQRCLCWEKRLLKKNNCSTAFSSEENGIAKLVLEVHSRHTDVDSLDDSIIKQEENEDTPKLPVIQNTDENNRPLKQKRRSSLSKADRTPTGPTPKKQKTRTRSLKSKLNTSTTDENSEKENMGEKSSISPSKLTLSPVRKPVPVSKPVLAKCKDVTSRAPHPSNRWGHSFCMVHDNMAVLVGGQGERQQICKDSVWSLDPVTRKWRDQDIVSEIANQKPEYRMGHTATYDPTLRCVYVYGGSKNLKWFHDVHMLDVDEWKWNLLKVAGKAPTRAYHSATLYRNELWIFGGVYPRPDPQPDGCSNEVHIFSPVMENWYAPIVNGEKPLPRSGHSATLINDQLVMFGGWDAPYCYNDLYVLDMSIVEWTKPVVNGTPPSPRSWHASCALSGNRILIHGGYDGDLALDDVHVFTLATHTWMKIKMDPIPIPRAGHQAICLPYNHENEEQDEVLIFGGGNNDGSFYHDLLSANIPFNPIEDSTILKESVQNV